MRKCDKVFEDERSDGGKSIKGEGGVAIESREERDRLCCCGKGHQPPL